MEAKDTDHWALDTLLALVAVSMPPTAWSPLSAPQGPCVLPTTLHQAPAWAWEEILQCLLPTRPHGLTPALDLLPPVWALPLHSPLHHTHEDTESALGEPEGELPNLREHDPRWLPTGFPLGSTGPKGECPEARVLGT